MFYLKGSKSKEEDPAMLPGVARKVTFHQDYKFLAIATEILSNFYKTLF